MEERPLRRLARPALKALMKLSSGAIVLGRGAFAYVLGLAVPAERVFTAPNSVDSQRFAPVDSGEERRRIRSFMGLPDGTLCSYVGRLVERKGMRELIEAFKLVVKKKPDVRLILVGEGALREHLERVVRADPLLASKVHLLGYCPYERLPLLYAASDVFVFPTREDAWGMVLNEAMSAGLPVISTNRAGASLDLIVDGVTGFIVETGNVEAFAASLNRLINEKALAIEMAKRARRRILQGFTPSHQAKCLVRAMLASLKSGEAD